MQFPYAVTTYAVTTYGMVLYRVAQKECNDFDR